MTRDIEYLQYHLRYSSLNFKRNMASYTPTGTVTEIKDVIYVLAEMNF